MDERTQAVLFNAVPLLVLALLYLLVTVVLTPALIRERGRLRDVDVVTAIMFPCIGIAAFAIGIVVLASGKAIVIGKEPAAPAITTPGPGGTPGGPGGGPGGPPPGKMKKD